MRVFLGIDFGTSGARAIAIGSDDTIRSRVSIPFPGKEAGRWREILFALLEGIPLAIRKEIVAIAIDGTSSTVLLCDASGIPIEEPLLYDDDRGGAAIGRVRAIAPADHPVITATSSLAKLFWWSERPDFGRASYFLHQADWLGFLLHGKLGIGDYHNALKLGYDVENCRYPDWLRSLPFFPLLPEILAPGTPIGTVSAEIARRFHLRADCQVSAGTTDSIAAFLAVGARAVGDAVTSLGSTLVIKLLSDTRVDAARYGIYSHRWGNLWLAGGASNTGGAVLRRFFTDEEIGALSLEIDPARESPLDYYPLLRPGDRFLSDDPLLPPRLEPRPEDDREFLHGLLESIARIEASGYRRLRELGAGDPRRVYTAGGGANNPTWSKIRERHLGVPVLPSARTEAAYGSAWLARESVGGR